MGNQPADDPRAVEFAQELERLVARHRPEWMQARKWIDDGAVVFGGSNSVEVCTGMCGSSEREAAACVR